MKIEHSTKMLGMFLLGILLIAIGLILAPAWVTIIICGFVVATTAWES